MSDRRDVLVAIMNNLHDFAILREQSWYRIPVDSVNKWLKDDWPPDWLAFYQTKVFGHERYSIRYFGKVKGKPQIVHGWQIIPERSKVEEKGERQYYQIFLESLIHRERPILSYQWHRVTFIPTTLQKFNSATEINDLYDSSVLEDRLWEEFKRLQIPLERQKRLTLNNRNYFLDFAITCEKGNLAIETDGDSYHANPEQAGKDMIRNNEIETNQWRVLHFSTRHIQEQMQEYCIPTIVKNINNLGGYVDESGHPRKIDLNLPPGSYQPTLF